MNEVLSLNPKYEKDDKGNSIVKLPLSEYNMIIEELEELEDLRLYDESNSNDDGTRVNLNDYLQGRSLNERS